MRQTGRPFVVVAQTAAAVLGTVPVAAIQVARAKIGTGGARLIAYLPAASLAQLLNASNQASGTTLYVVGDGRAFGPGGTTGAAGAVTGRTPQRATIAGKQVQAASVGLPGGAAIVATYPQSVLDDAIQQIRVRTIIAVFGMSLVIAALAWWLVRSLTDTLRVFAVGIRAVRRGPLRPAPAGPRRRRVLAVRRASSTTCRASSSSASTSSTPSGGACEEFDQRFGAALAATHDVASLLEIVVDSAMQLPAPAGRRLLVADEGTSVLVEQLRRGDLRRSRPACSTRRCGYGEGVEGRALQSRQAVRSATSPCRCSRRRSWPRHACSACSRSSSSPDSPLRTRTTPSASARSSAQGAVAIENARLHRLIQKQAKTDPLTQLLNRREFEEQLGARGRARPALRHVSVGLVVLDLDDFKLINDRFGHLAGDGVLKAAAAGDPAVHA